MTYVMGFVAAVPVANKKAYQAFAEESVGYFKGLGVTRMLESWGDDVSRGKVTDFYRAVAAKPDEEIVYSFQFYPDAAAAAAANEKMANDPAMAEMGAKMPFDGARMIYGGFDVVAERHGKGETGYLEGSIIAVPNSARQSYIDYANKLSALFLAHGAVRSVDAWGDEVPDGKVTDFKKAVAAKNDETVVLGWIEWPSKQVRDGAWPKMMEDPLLQNDGVGIDESRRVFGGFVPILDR
ncbi:DUF1428 domain-containing protein [Pelagibacterium sp.]|uniref:DUF1428 domain-containing protein n=1 Tax=Pelagibacterium sp. TaxID=1967288 RepID=UPI003A902746